MMAASMRTRFDKVMEMVARAGRLPESDYALLEGHSQKVRRLEDLIRAREAFGDRIVVGIGAALVISAMALPVYAAYYSNGYAYISNASSLSFPRGSVVEAKHSPAAPATTGSIETVAQYRHDRDIDGPLVTSSVAGATRLTRYVIHRATEAAALIEGPDGLWWVTPGMKIPGAGQIISIERSGAGWSVVTSDTIITDSASSNPSS